MSTTKHHEREPERTEASPPKPKPPAAPAAQPGDLPSINEPPRPAEAGHEKTPPDSNVSHETKRTR